MEFDLEYNSEREKLIIPEYGRHIQKLVNHFNLEENPEDLVLAKRKRYVNYFETESDANININEITGLYTNTSNPQEVYARITNTITNCFEVIPFEISVSLGPHFVQPSDFELCDNYDDGDNSNGRVIFDLPTKNEEILDGQNPTEFNITYHENHAQAEAGQNPLADSYHNSNPNLEQIYVRIESALNANCYATTSLNLVVLDTPEALNTIQVQCSDSSTTLFNLTNSNEIITGNIDDRSTLFYHSLNDALNNTNGIDNSESYTSSSNPETLYVRVTDNNTGCFSISELELQISNTMVNNAQIIKCDTDGSSDGFFEFDLSQANSDVLIGAPANSTIAYYSTMNDALLETNELPNNYTNTISENQIIFARVENIDQCYGIAEIELIVNPQFVSVKIKET